MSNILPTRTVTVATNEIVDVRSVYGAVETNGLVNGQEYHDVDRSVTVDWTDPRLAEITRLRLLTDPGYPAWDVSYCHGRLKDGTECRVQVPFSDLPKGPGRIQAAIIAHAKRDNVFAKGLGIFNAISKL